MSQAAILSEGKRACSGPRLEECVFLSSARRAGREPRPSNCQRHLGEIGGVKGTGFQYKIGWHLWYLGCKNTWEASKMVGVNTKRGPACCRILPWSRRPWTSQRLFASLFPCSVTFTAPGHTEATWLPSSSKAWSACARNTGIFFPSDFTKPNPLSSKGRSWPSPSSGKSLCFICSSIGHTAYPGRCLLHSPQLLLTWTGPHKNIWRCTAIGPWKQDQGVSICTNSHEKATQCRFSDIQRPMGREQKWYASILGKTANRWLCP